MCGGIAPRVLIIDIRLRLIVQLHAATFFTPGEQTRVTHWIGDSVDSRTSLGYYGEIEP